MCVSTSYLFILKLYIFQYVYIEKFQTNLFNIAPVSSPGTTPPPSTGMYVLVYSYYVHQLYCEQNSSCRGRCTSHVAFYPIAEVGM